MNEPITCHPIVQKLDEYQRKYPLQKQVPIKYVREWIIGQSLEINSYWRNKRSPEYIVQVVNTQLLGKDGQSEVHFAAIGGVLSLPSWVFLSEYERIQRD